MKTLKNVIGTLLIVLLSAACVLLVVPRAFGIQLYCIVSGSMEPSYRLNDLIYTIPTECAEIRAGDTISFSIPGTDSIVTHRVVENNIEKRCVFTKGDANDAADAAPVSYENIKGVVRFRIPKIGLTLMMLSSKLGRIICITAGAAIILISMILAVDTAEPEQPKQSREKRRSPRPEKAERVRAAKPIPQARTQTIPRDNQPTGQACRGDAAYAQGSPEWGGQAAYRQQPAPTPPTERHARTKNDLPPGWR